METEIKELEAKIYATYYDNGGEDARYGLWPAVMEAKKATDPLEELTQILDGVELGYY